jgi:hypothetical protein
VRGGGGDGGGIGGPDPDWAGPAPVNGGGAGGRGRDGAGGGELDVLDQVWRVRGYGVFSVPSAAPAELSCPDHCVDGFFSCTTICERFICI